MACTERVARNFSRDPAAYHRQARVQRRVATALARRLAADSIGRPLPGRILELGCGTGFLSRHLAMLWPAADLTVTDISPAMLAFCQDRLRPAARRRPGAVRFALCDATRPLPGGPYDLIAASLMAQWIPDLAALLRQWRARLRPGGGIALSTLTSKTFAEIRERFAAADVPFPSPAMPGREDLAAAIAAADLQASTLATGLRRERHASLHGFLRHLQALGAVNAVAPPLSPDRLRRMLRREPGPITAHYQVATLILWKSSESPLE